MVKTPKSKTSKMKTGSRTAKTSVRKSNSRAAKTPIPRSKTTAKSAKAKFTWRENLVLGLVATCAVCLIAALVINDSFDPKRTAETTLASLADNYYIHHYYPLVISQNPDQPEAVLARYAKSGLPTIHLRQLLHFANSPQAESNLRNNYYSCDTNRTSVRYYPVEPYGPHDYETKFTYACQDFTPE